MTEKDIQALGSEVSALLIRQMRFNLDVMVNLRRLARGETVNPVEFDRLSEKLMAMVDRTTAILKILGTEDELDDEH